MIDIQTWASSAVKVGRASPLPATPGSLDPRLINPSQNTGNVNEASPYDGSPDAIRDQKYRGYAGDAYYGNNGIVYDEDLHVPCPAHTTERKLIAKVDIRVIPVLCVLYLLAFLDRVNISNARTFGLEADLGMNPKSLQFSTAVG